MNRLVSIVLVSVALTALVSAAEQPMDPQEQSLRMQAVIQELSAQREIANQRAAALAAELAVTQDKLRAATAKPEQKDAPKK